MTSIITRRAGEWAGGWVASTEGWLVTNIITRTGEWVVGGQLAQKVGELR